MLSSRLKSRLGGGASVGGGGGGNFDARARIEQSRRAKLAQEKVDAIRNKQRSSKIDIKRGFTSANGNNNSNSASTSSFDLSSKLSNRRRKFSTAAIDQQRQVGGGGIKKQKTLPNFTIVTTVEPNRRATTAAAPINITSLIRRNLAIPAEQPRSVQQQRMGNFTRTIVNDKVTKPQQPTKIVTTTAAIKRRNVNSSSNDAADISPLFKRRREIVEMEEDDYDEDQDFSMMADDEVGNFVGTGRVAAKTGRAGGGMMFLSALKGAQPRLQLQSQSQSILRDQRSRIGGGLGGGAGGTMIADAEQEARRRKAAKREELCRKLQQRLQYEDDSAAADETIEDDDDHEDGDYNNRSIAGGNTGFKVLITNLNDLVTSDDVKELFGAVGNLRDAYLIKPGLAEAIFVKKSDAEAAVKEFHNRQLDDVPMRCKLIPPGTIVGGGIRPKPSNVTINGRFQQGGGRNGDQQPQMARKKWGDDGPAPERDLITSILFRNRAGTSASSANDNVTFTVKV